MPIEPNKPLKLTVHEHMFARIVVRFDVNMHAHEVLPTEETPSKKLLRELRAGAFLGDRVRDITEEECETLRMCMRNYIETQQRRLERATTHQMSLFPEEPI